MDDYRIVPINDSILDIKDFIDLNTFSYKIEKEQRHSKGPSPSANMTMDAKIPGGLGHILFIERRFKPTNGQFYLLYKDNDIIAVSGIYKSDFDKNIAIAGVRTWTLEEHRGKRFLHGDILLPEQEKWAINNNIKSILLTFNDYNLWLFEFIKRMNQKKSVSLGVKTSNFYMGFQPLPDQLYIKNTYQYVLEKKLDPTFTWDSTSLTKLYRILNE